MCVDLEYNTQVGEPHPDALMPARPPIAKACHETCICGGKETNTQQSDHSFS